VYATIYIEYNSGNRKTITENNTTYNTDEDAVVSTEA
jgi:hypothetical protein